MDGSFEQRLEVIQGRMAEACRRAGRHPSAVRLLPVSKTFGPDAVRAGGGARVGAALRGPGAARGAEEREDRDPARAARTPNGTPGAWPAPAARRLD